MFIFMGIWWTIDALIPSVNLLKGTYGIIVRVVIAVFVLIMLFMYLRIKKNGKK